MNGKMKGDKGLRCWAACSMVLLLSPILYVGARRSSGNGGTERIITADVSALSGGTFSDDPLQPTFTVSIPPGAVTPPAQNFGD